MPTHVMGVVAERAVGLRPVLSGAYVGDELLTILGDGDSDYVCGACGRILAVNLRHGQQPNLVVRCSECGAYNEFL